MHHHHAAAPRGKTGGGGGIGIFGWFLIILGVCGTLFNLALYYKITHVESPSSSSESTGDAVAESNNNDNNHQDATSHHRHHHENSNNNHKNDDKRIAQELEHIKSNEKNAHAENDDDGGEAAKQRKREHRRHLREQGGNNNNDDDNKHRHHHQENNDKKGAHHHHDNKHQHHRQAGKQEQQEEKPFNVVGAAGSGAAADDQQEAKNKKLVQEHIKKHHHQHNEENDKQWDDALKANEHVQDQHHQKHHHHHRQQQQEKEKEQKAVVADDTTKHHHQHHDHEHNKIVVNQDAAASKNTNNEEEEQKELEEEKKLQRHRLHEKHKHQRELMQMKKQHAEEEKQQQNNDKKKEEGEEHHHHHDQHEHHQKHHHHHDHNNNNKGEEESTDGEENAKKNEQQQQEEVTTATQQQQNNNKPLSRKERLKFGRKAFHQFDQSSFSSVDYDTAWSNFDNWTSKEHRLTNVEQSSNNFQDIVEQPNMGVLLPEDGDGFFDDIPAFWAKEEEEDEKIMKEKNITPCDPDDAVFTPEKDRICVHYLRNPKNWVSIKVMSSILSTGRTIKFKVFLKYPSSSSLKKENDDAADDDGGAGSHHHSSSSSSSTSSTSSSTKQKYLAAIVKVSQKKFLLEPASEVEAFYTDRFIGFNKVPPVSWTPVPLKFLQAACGTLTQFYSNWFKQFVEENRGAKLLISKRGPSMMHKYLNVSLQLWMNNVHDADQTEIRPSMSYAKYLACSSSSSATNSSYSSPPPPPSKFTDPSQWTETKNISLSGLVDVSLFDFIIGNSDRWFGHNMFALEYPKTATNSATTANSKKSSLIFLDQGSSFYSRSIPNELIYYRKLSPEEKEKVKSGELSGEAKDDANTRRDLCRFRRSVAEKILQLGLDVKDEKDDYYHYMRNNLPSGLFHVGSPSLLKACRSRIGALARMIRDCKKSCGGDENQVFVWE